MGTQDRNGGVMIPNPPTPEERALFRMEKELHALYKIIELKDKAIMILIVAIPVIGVFGFFVGFFVGVS